MNTVAKWGLYIIVFILLKMTNDYVPRDIDSELLPYVESFEKWTNTKLQGKYYSIKFARQYPGVAGVAIGMNNDDAVIVRVDPIIWARLSEHQRSWLVYHELAHDVHNSRHGSSFLMSRSIPIHLTDRIMEAVKEQYNKTLKYGTNKI